MSWQILDRITKEIEVLKKAPVSSLALIAIGIGLSYLYFGQQNEFLKQRDEGYRRALGMEKAYTSAYEDISNDDLRLLARSMAAKIRRYQLEAERKESRANVRWRNKEITDSQHNDLIEAAQEQMRSEFSQQLRSDAIVLDTELRSRLSAAALRTIVGAGPLLDPNIPFANLVPPQFNEMAMNFLASGLEQMADKLPPNKHRRWVWPLVTVVSAFVLLALFWAIHSGFRVVRIRGPQSPPASQA